MEEKTEIKKRKNRGKIGKERKRKRRRRRKAEGEAEAQKIRDDSDCMKKKRVQPRV